MVLATAVVALLPVAIGARTQPASQNGDAIITRGPRAWALATTALLAYRNRERLDMLPPSLRNPANVKQTREILHDWWGIDSRLGLLRELESLDHVGHRAEFHKVARSLLSMPDAQYQALLRNHPERARIRLTREHFERYRGSSLIAWDYCRYIMLCRWGYLVGFLTEDEAWGRIMPAARTIQHGFRSWAEVGDDYLAGRQFWSREEMDRTGN